MKPSFSIIIYDIFHLKYKPGNITHTKEILRCTVMFQFSGHLIRSRDHGQLKNYGHQPSYLLLIKYNAVYIEPAIVCYFVSEKNMLRCCVIIYRKIFYTNTISFQVCTRFWVRLGAVGRPPRACQWQWQLNQLTPRKIM